jgi:hypothetical protein
VVVKSKTVWAIGIENEPREVGELLRHEVRIDALFRIEIVP